VYGDRAAASAEVLRRSSGIDDSVTPVILGFSGFLLIAAASVATVWFIATYERKPVVTVTWIDETDVIERETRALYAADAIEWDRKFEAATDSLPEFSPLHAERVTVIAEARRMAMMQQINTREPGAVICTTHQLDAIFRDIQQQKQDEYSRNLGLAAQSGVLSGLIASGHLGSLGGVFGVPRGRKDS
jgi:hypothetical protein